MHVSIELLAFIFSLIIQLIAVGVFIGVYKTTINFMQQEIIDLKEEMKKYNNYLERLIKLESNISAIWLKLDGWKDR